MNGVTWDEKYLIETLRGAGLVRTSAPVLRPLPGGVSSEIVQVVDGSDRFVIKRALAKLKVRDDWFADTSRSRSELAYLQLANSVVPGCVPRVLYASPSGEWFAMEFLGEDFANWKALLLRGDARIEHARKAGRILARIHQATWGNDNAARDFATLDNFRQLRLEPYFTTTAQRVPDLAAQLTAVADELADAGIALVHGDFSPKNILLSDERLVLLDAEVAWYGDPCFDTAFLLTHFYLKALVHAGSPEHVLAMPDGFWTSYLETLGAPYSTGLEDRTVRVLLSLLLARVHGKSPVEYLNSSQQAIVTRFVRDYLGDPPLTLAALTTAWGQKIRS